MRSKVSFFPVMNRLFVHHLTLPVYIAPYKHHDTTVELIY